MSKHTNLPVVNVSGTAAQQLVTALADAKAAQKRAKDAATKSKGKNGSVTGHVVAYAAEIRAQMGERKIAVGGTDGEYAAIRGFIVDNKGDKGLATNLAQLTCWLANDVSLVERAALATADEDGKPTGWVGYQKAHAAVKRLVSPPARSWKDTLSELAEILGEESDGWKAAIAGLSGRDALRAIMQAVERTADADEEEGEDE
jgi:hypothetical protein